MAFAGRALSAPAFPDDDGTAPPALAAALSAGDSRGIVEALLGCRVLVPVVAVLDDQDVGNPPTRSARDKEADMAVVTVRAANGRLALPVFSSVTALAAWSNDARPVPVVGVLAARAAFDEGAEALLIDPAGACRAVVEGAALVALAEGRTPGRAWADPHVRAAVFAAATGAGLDPDTVNLGPDTPADSVDLVVRVDVAPAAFGAQLADQIRAFAGALVDDSIISSRAPRGVDVQVSETDSPSSDTAFGDTPGSTSS